MMTIPEVRVELLRLAGELPSEQAHRLLDLVEQMYRRKAVRRAPTQSTPITPELTARIRSYALNHPDTTVQDIAYVFGVSSGRVSEAVAGKRV